MMMTRWVGRLILANVVVFIITLGSPAMTRALMLVPAFILQRPWTPVTYMFLHADFMHILFNMIGLYFFGPRLEQRLGGKAFLGLYFSAGVGGALLSILTPYAAIVGASGAVFGVLLGYARNWPRDRIYIWGILPLEAWLLVVIVTVASLYFGFSSTRGSVAHFAHLGGFAGGYLFLKWRELRSPARKFKKAVSAPARRPGGDGADLKRWQRIDREKMHPVNRDELDRVLEKIKASGVGSLTPDERAFLDRFSPE